MPTVHLPFDPAHQPRELARHYISASDAEIAAMLDRVGASSLADLFGHIPRACRFETPPALPEELSYADLTTHLAALAGKNHPRPSFLGDALPDFTVPPVAWQVASIRKLTTSYTPYQPERSQGTLMTQWIYQCLMSRLLGFEAVNCSLYDRSTAIFEACTCALRLTRGTGTVLLAETLFPQDLEVVDTLVRSTGIEALVIPMDPATGRLDHATLQDLITGTGKELGAVVFPQVNHFGLLEDVDAITEMVHASRALAVGVVDPMHLAPGGLKAPCDWGEGGVDIVVGEAQHLALEPCFGGPGLGIFAVRYNAKVKNHVRQTPGRYVGRAKDAAGRDALVMVLSTREQHIRKDKATSNICSNQAYLATMAGAALLARGDDGLASQLAIARARALEAAGKLTALPGIALAFPDAPFVNELTLEVPADPATLIEAARTMANLHLGVEVSARIGEGERRLLKLSFSDRPEQDVAALVNFFASHVADTSASADNTQPQRGATPLPPRALRAEAPGLPRFDEAEILAYYQRLGELNVSPDDAVFPLGSCTMKYNPMVNDWAAGLPGFTRLHPQAPLADAQGNLELLFQTQEWFKAITGLAGVTTQPVAGAQGELVGVKMFQAYHHDRGEAHRDVIFIPDTAHGTNFATAVMAGYPTKKVDGLQVGIVLLTTGPDGCIDEADFNEKLAVYRKRLAGVMITNPNTTGIFENRFREIADAVHDAGGLVYMDGANMNAIAGWCDLGAMGVDAVHNNTHKTWTIPHGGGGPGDAFVAVSERLVDFLPGQQIVLVGEAYTAVRPPKSIGDFHRHWGNFAHKVRAYSYLRRLGREGVPQMAAVATLSARYCLARLRETYPTLPATDTPRMHEFILTLDPEDFDRLEVAGVPRALIIARVGKLFLDFGFHAPTVAWPETFGLMIEPTESYTQAELDRFCAAIEAIKRMIREHPEVLTVVPLFTPVDQLDDVAANRSLILHEEITALPATHPNRLAPAEIAAESIDALYDRIVAAAKEKLAPAIRS